MANVCAATGVKEIITVEQILRAHNELLGTEKSLWPFWSNKVDNNSLVSTTLALVHRAFRRY